MMRIDPGERCWGDGESGGGGRGEFDLALRSGQRVPRRMSPIHDRMVSIRRPFVYRPTVAVDIEAVAVSEKKKISHYETMRVIQRRE